MKHKLKLETLAVDTFEIPAGDAAPRGTVRANSGTVMARTIHEWTCLVDDCQPTFVYSCGKPDTFCCD